MNERRFGILIASSRFPDEPKLEDLRCPENDVDGLYEVLTSKDRGGFTETIVLKNQPHHEVLKNINRILKQAQKNDLVLIFYSGHGRLDLAGRLYLATADTEIETLEATSIPVNNIKDYIDVSPSKKSVLLLDCCYSGAVGKALLRGGVQEQLQQISGGRGIYILTGSTDIQAAQEKESDQYGLFSKHVIEGIRKGDADQDNDGLITMDDLYGYVHEKVLEEGPQEPMKWAVGVRGDLIISRSGKTPREERRKQIREILSELWTKGILPEDILDNARKVSALNPEQISGELRAYDDLLDQLIQKKVEVGEFISKWYKVGPKPPTSIPEMPPFKTTEPKPDKPEPAKVKPAEPKPDATATTEPRPSQRIPPKSRKASYALKFGAAVGVIVLLIVGSWWAGLQTNKVEKKIKEKFNMQVLNLKNEIEELDKLEQIEELHRRIALLNHQIKVDKVKTEKVKFQLELEEIQVRLNLIQRQLANKENELIAARKGRIFVESVPDTATVEILNIDQGFRQGMELAPGKYHVQVSSKGYEPQERWIEIGASEEKRIDFELKKIAPKTGRLFIQSVPEDAIIRILNIMPKFNQGMELEAGSYHVEIEAKGYEIQRRWIDLGVREEKQISFELENIPPKVARIFVETFPKDATVRILNIKPKFFQGMELDPGNYHVEVEAEGYETERKWIGLVSGHEKPFRIELAKIKDAELTSPQKTIMNSIGMQFVLIPAGSFKMGSQLNLEEIARRYGGKTEWDKDEQPLHPVEITKPFYLQTKAGGYKDEQPLHPVEITKPFYLQTTEVSQGQWKKVMDNDNPSLFKNCGDDCPVERVSWKDAQEFIDKLNKMERIEKYRLPTEAEWEYACRAETTTPFFTGECISADQANYYAIYPGENCPKGEYRGETVKVGSFQSNAWGLYNMHGNVSEWCQDWYGDYLSNSVVDPKGPDKGEYRVLRGGSWNFVAWVLRSANRRMRNHDSRNSRDGFRVARDY